MIPIILHGKAGDNGYSYNDFESHFLHICETHREDRRALAFAFILYDLETPQIAKALHDPDYWRALDKISGDRLSVFSFHCVDRKKLKTDDRWHFMIGVTDTTFNDGRGLLEKYFDLDHNINLPAMLFFQVSERKIIGTHLVQLKEETIEAAFQEIKEIISIAASAVSEVKDEYHRNDSAVFHLIEDSLKDRKKIVIVKTLAKKILSITEVLSLFS